MEGGFFENLKAISTDIEDINFQRFATVTQCNGEEYTVREQGDDGAIHNNVLSLVNPLKVGDNVVLGFVDNSIYSPVIIGALNKKTGGSIISYGTVDSTSTSTAFTATVPGIDKLEDGTIVMLHNGVVTSASGFTININGLGEKAVYNNMTNATRETTIFNIAYTMLFIYDSGLDEGNGGFWCYRGYDSNTNTIGYQLRTNSLSYVSTDKYYRYRLMLQTDDLHIMPVNLSTSTNATALREPNQRPFMMNGEILYYSATAIINAGDAVSSSNYWKQYTLTLGYSFNSTGAALVLSYPKPIYLICEPTGGGMARIHGWEEVETPTGNPKTNKYYEYNSTSGKYVLSTDTTVKSKTYYHLVPSFTDTIPEVENNLAYIYLGNSYSATAIELNLKHPIYEYKNGSIRPYRDYYTKAEIDALLSQL